MFYLKVIIAHLKCKDQVLPNFKPVFPNLLKCGENLVIKVKYSGYLNQTHVVIKWLKRGWMPNGLVFECHSDTVQPNHLNTRQIDAILFSYVLVWYLNGRSST